MQGTIWEWNVEKLEGGGSQMPVTCPFHGVCQSNAVKNIKPSVYQNITVRAPKAVILLV